MAVDPERWYFTKEQLMNSPSRRHGVDPEKELSYRQQAANLIQDMGQRLNVTQLCINTAIMYMHRFYMYHSFQKFHRNSMGPTCLFIAAKVEEQPRKLEHVVRVAHLCLNRDAPPLDPQSEAYLEKAQEIVIIESILLQTLGFNVAIDHPHTYVVKCTQLIRANKDLAQTAYFMATNSLHLTTFSLQYKPTTVACVCIHLACKWSNWEIPLSSDGKHWWEYVDNTVTQSKLDELTSEFVQIMDRCPSRLKRKIHITKSNAQTTKKIKNEPSSAESSPGLTPSTMSTMRTTVVDAAQPSTSKANAELSNHDRQSKRDFEKEVKVKLEAQTAHREYKERGKVPGDKDKSEPNTALAEYKQKSGEHPHGHRSHHSHSKERKHGEHRYQHVKQHGGDHHKLSSESRHASVKAHSSEHVSSASSELLRVGGSDHQHHRQHAESVQRGHSERRPHSAEQLLGSKDNKHRDRSQHQRNPSEHTQNGTKVAKDRQSKSEHKERQPSVNPAEGMQRVSGHSSSKEREKQRPDHHHYHHHHHRQQQKHHSSGEKRSAPHSQKTHSSSATGKRPHSPGRVARLQPHTKNPESYSSSPAKKAATSSSYVSPSKQSGLTLPSNQSLLRLPMPPPDPTTTQLAETDILQQALSVALMNESSGSESGRTDPNDFSMFLSHQMTPQQLSYFTTQPPLPTETGAVQPPLPPDSPPPLPQGNPPPLPPLPPPP